MTNNVPERPNLFHLRCSHYATLSVEMIFASSPDAASRLQQLVFLLRQEAPESLRSSSTLWSTDHALFWFPFDLTVSEQRLAPTPPLSSTHTHPDSHLAGWHELHRYFKAVILWQSCSNATEVVIFSVWNARFWFMTIFFSFFFLFPGSSDLPDCDVWSVKSVRHLARTGRGGMTQNNCLC